jgi:hypothetical protein
MMARGREALPQTENRPRTAAWSAGCGACWDSRMPAAAGEPRVMGDRGYKSRKPGCVLCKIFLSPLQEYLRIL